MPSRRRILFAGLLALLLALFVFWIMPTAVARGVRGWLWWQARKEGLKVEIEKVDAPFLQPVVIRGLHITSANDASCKIDLKIGQAVVDLELARILTGASGRAIDKVVIDTLQIETRCYAASGPARSKLAWSTIQKLLPNNLNIGKLDLRVEEGATIVLLRNASLSASQLEAGRFSAGEFTVASPLFRQTFSDLRGATGWQNNRLTLGGFTLANGLAVQSMTTDLSQLGKKRVGIELDVDAFGGKLRASVANEWRQERSNWSIAGSAKEISLAQTSEAFGFTNQIGGMLHACKFTFHGDARDLSQTTASIWMELTESSWAGRKSEVIMLGAALNNRQIQLQQFYVKQRKNQLTLSGEGAIPSNSSNWLSPDFRCDVSGSIHDLGEFAGLFGAKAGDFAGEIAIEGTMNARDRKIGGYLTLGGASLTLFRTSIDALTAKLNLKAPELEIEQFELKRKSDRYQAQGRIDMSNEHNYSGTLNATIKNVGEYLSIWRGPAAHDAKPTPAELNVAIESATWDVTGAIAPPNSSPLNFTAHFPLRIGTDWSAFLSSPINATFDFPSLFLANVPQFFHPDIFLDGILSGKLSISETLQHPRITGDLQLLNGKLHNAPMDLVEANGRLTFAGDRGTIEFLNVSTKDVDLSFRGEIDLRDQNDVAIKLAPILPIFDLTTLPIDCVGNVEVAPVGLTLAAPIEEMEIRGKLFQGNWSLVPKEHGIARSVRLCFGNAIDNRVLSFGAHPRPTPESSRPRKSGKRRAN
jgi:hypothetical protein